MKKIATTIIALFTISSSLLAQYKLEQGQSQLNAGVGFSNWGIPVYVGMDYGVHQHISIGGEVSFRSYNDNWHHKQSTLGLTFNSNFHFTGLLGIPDNWDIYAGLNIGGFYRSNANTGITSSGLGIGGQFGARYYFTDNFGINLELGGGTIFDGGKFGITYVF